MPHAHLIGACGSGMKAVAEYLGERGWMMTASDSSPTAAMRDRFARRGLCLHAGHQPEYLGRDTQLVIYSPAVDESNPELQKARERGIPCRSYAELLGDLMHAHTGVSIAGTHGKSTTTAMVVHVLQIAGFDPSAIMGAEFRGTERSGFAGSGELFVAESCEFRRHFLHQRPRCAAILGVEWDHVDCFPEPADLEQAFFDFAAALPADGTLVLNALCPSTGPLKRVAPCRSLTFGRDSGADWSCLGHEETIGGVRFRVLTPWGAANMEMPVHGCHNVDNALAACAVCQVLGVDLEAIRSAFRTFPGIRRRFEVLGDWNGITVIDDFAHHPTAVQATLETVRTVYPGRRLWCAFQPHQVSRTRAFLTEFAAALSLADQTLITPIFAAREQASPAAIAVAAELAVEVQKHGGCGRFTESLDRLLTSVEDEARPDDVVVTMGAGDIFQVHDELNRRLHRNHSA